MKSLTIQLDDEFHDAMTSYFVREGRDMFRWIHMTLRLHGPFVKAHKNSQLEECRKAWESRIDQCLSSGLYDDLAEVFRKHGIELNGFYQNGLRVEESKAAYSMLLSIPGEAGQK